MVHGSEHTGYFVYNRPAETDYRIAEGVIAPIANACVSGWADGDADSPGQQSFTNLVEAACDGPLPAT